MSELTGDAASEFRRLLRSIECGAVGLGELPSTPPPCPLGGELPADERRYLRATVSLIWRLTLSSACVVAARGFETRRRSAEAEAAETMAETYRGHIHRETELRTEASRAIDMRRQAELDRRALAYVTESLGLDR